MLWFGATAFIFLLTGFLILSRTPVCKAGEKLSLPLASVSVIIPARNEERNLPALLDSLKNQTLQPNEIIVVDDKSEDATAGIAEEYGAKVLTSSDLPEGWLGKPWACYQGAMKAKGDIFIFLDADTFSEPDGLEKMVSAFLAGSGVVSILPYHMVGKFHESFSAFFNLMQLIGMGRFTLLKGLKPKGMFGPCLVISREDYIKSEGHKAVRGEVLEHYALAGILEGHSVPVRLFSGRKTLNVRMYPDGWKDLIQGWTKSFILGAGETPSLIMRLSIMWISGLIIAPAFLMFSIFSQQEVWIIFWAVIYMLYLFQLFIQFRKAGNFPLWSVILYPFILIFFLIIFSRASYMMKGNGKILWKGREIN